MCHLRASSVFPCLRSKCGEDESRHRLLGKKPNRTRTRRAGASFRRSGHEFSRGSAERFAQATFCLLTAADCFGGCFGGRFWLSLRRSGAFTWHYCTCAEDVRERTIFDFAAKMQTQPHEYRGTAWIDFCSTKFFERKEKGWIDFSKHRNSNDDRCWPTVASKVLSRHIAR